MDKRILGTMIGKDMNGEIKFLVIKNDNEISYIPLFGEIENGRYDISIEDLNLEEASMVSIEGFKITSDVIEAVLKNALPGRSKYMDRCKIYITNGSNSDTAVLPCSFVRVKPNMASLPSIWVWLSVGEFVNQKMISFVRTVYTDHIPGGENMEYPASATINFEDNNGGE